MVQMFMRDLKKVSALSALERFCYITKPYTNPLYKRFLRNSSALEDVHFREVPLYFSFLDPPFPKSQFYMAIQDHIEWTEMKKKPKF